MPELWQICGGEDRILRKKEDRLRLRSYHQCPHGEAGGPRVPPLRQHGGLRPDQRREGQVPRVP